ncbi:hypothetical protein JCM3770_006999 [Rhodotorula araucariae]
MADSEPMPDDLHFVTATERSALLYSCLVSLRFRQIAQPVLWRRVSTWREASLRHVHAEHDKLKQHVREFTVQLWDVTYGLDTFWPDACTPAITFAALTHLSFIGLIAYRWLVPIRLHDLYISRVRLDVAGLHPLSKLRNLSLAHVSFSKNEVDRFLHQRILPALRNLYVDDIVEGHPDVVSGSIPTIGVHLAAQLETLQVHLHGFIPRVQLPDVPSLAVIVKAPLTAWIKPRRPISHLELFDLPEFPHHPRWGCAIPDVDNFCHGHLLSLADYLDTVADNSPLRTLTMPEEIYSHESP